MDVSLLRIVSVGKLNALSRFFKVVKNFRAFSLVIVFDLASGVELQTALLIFSGSLMVPKDLANFSVTSEASICRLLFVSKVKSGEGRL